MNELTDEQVIARNDLLPFLKGRSAGKSVLSGYAGTGKTYLVADFIRALDGMRVAVSAPTNKAVRVAKDMLERAGIKVSEAGEPAFGSDSLFRMRRAETFVACRTIHSLLGIKVKELPDGKQETRREWRPSIGDFDVVIVDEASMVGADLFRMINEEAIKKGVRLLFVGDPAQLPPVSDGKDSPVFSDDSDKKVVAKLTKIVRQAEGNPVIRLSMAIREAMGEGRRILISDIERAIGEGTNEAGECRIEIQRGGPDAALACLVEALAWKKDMDIRIVAYTNDRVLWYNKQAHEALYGEEAYPFCPGERVVMQSQFELPEDDRLLNSEELIVRNCTEQRHPKYPRIPGWLLELERESGDSVDVLTPADRISFERKVTSLFDEWKRDKENKEKKGAGWDLRKAFADVRHAYATTAHKAQGSTFDTCIIDFNNARIMRDNVEFNRLLYVAVTRCRDYLVISL